MSLLKERPDRFSLEIKIVVINLRPHLDFLQLLDFLLLARVLLFLLELIPVLPVIHNSAYGRLCQWCNLHKIEGLFMRHPYCVDGACYSNFHPVFVNQKNLR